MGVFEPWWRSVPVEGVRKWWFKAQEKSTMAEGI
jgi:hypothetical protein